MTLDEWFRGRCFAAGPRQTREQGSPALDSAGFSSLIRLPGFDKYRMESGAMRLMALTSLVVTGLLRISVRQVSRLALKLSSDNGSVSPGLPRGITCTGISPREVQYAARTIPHATQVSLDQTAAPSSNEIS